MRPVCPSVAVKGSERGQLLFKHTKRLRVELFNANCGFHKLARRYVLGKKPMTKVAFYRTRPTSDDKDILALTTFSAFTDALDPCDQVKTSAALSQGLEG